MNAKETRIIKWKSYRQQILENQNINESIINDDDELKNILKKFNLNINEILKSTNNSLITQKNISYEQEKDFQSIDEFLDQINKNEKMKTKKPILKEFNSHKYDENIVKYFSEFKSEDFSNTMTTNLKLKKINI